MIALAARIAVPVPPEQRPCLEELGHDIRDVAVDPATADHAIEALAIALTSQRHAAWIAAVTGIDALLGASPEHACGAARRRLRGFVAENADLVRRA
jgi:hypothetical protein